MFGGIKLHLSNRAFFFARLAVMAFILLIYLIADGVGKGALFALITFAAIGVVVLLVLTIPSRRRRED